MGAVARSLAGKHAGSALLQRAKAASPLFGRTQVSSCSSNTNYSTRRAAEELQFIKDREMTMLRDLAYKQPGLEPVHIQTAKQVSADEVKNRAVLIAAIGVLSGIGWYALSGTEGVVKPDGGQQPVDGRQPAPPGQKPADGQKPPPPPGQKPADGQKPPPPPGQKPPPPPGQKPAEGQKPPQG